MPAFTVRRRRIWAYGSASSSVAFALNWGCQARYGPLFRRKTVMRVSGKRLKRTRLIQSEKFVVAVAVEMVIPSEDPSEPCYESETVQLLREVKERAEKGEVAWLTEHGKVYTAIGAV